MVLVQRPNLGDENMAYPGHEPTRSALVATPSTVALLFELDLVLAAYRVGQVTGHKPCTNADADAGLDCVLGDAESVPNSEAVLA